MAEVAPSVAESVADPGIGESALWDTLRGDGSHEARGRLFDLYLPFARALAGRQYKARAGGGIEYSDLLQLACAGLLEAMDRYDPGLGVPFKGFAARRIKGSMIDGISKMSEVREQISFRQRVRRERIRSLAEPHGESRSKRDAMDALIEIAVGLALGFMLEGSGLYQEHEPSVAATAYDSLAWKDLQQGVAAELSRLPERERTIIRLHYAEDVGFDRIAALLNLSKGRISQLHKAALILLRKRVSRLGTFELER